MNLKPRSFADVVLYLYTALGIAYFVYLIGIVDPIDWTTASVISLACLPAVFLCIVLFSLLGSTEVKATVAIGFGSLGVCLYLAEFYLMLGHHKGLPLNFDRSTKLEKVLALRDNGIKAYPTIHPSYDALPGVKVNGKVMAFLAGVSNTETVYCNESGEFSVYRSDELGFRNPPGTWSLSKIDVALVGDSYTHGACVQTDEADGSFLRKQHINVLNLGYGGNGPLLQLAGIREYLTDRKPKVVVWLQSEGGVTRIDREINRKILKRYLNDPSFRQGSERSADALDDALRQFIDPRITDAVNDWKQYRFLQFFKLSQVRHLVSAYAHDYVPPRSMDIAARLRLLDQILAEAAETVHSWGGKFYFVLFEGGYRVTYIDQLRGLTSDNWQQRCADGKLDDILCDQSLMDEIVYRDEILKLARGHADRTIDFLEQLEKHPDPESLMPLRMPNHYNGMGYQLLADTIWQHLQEDVLSKTRASLSADR